MYRIGGLITLGMWAVSLAAQTAPETNNGVNRALRDLLKNYAQSGQATLKPGQIWQAWPAQSKVCAIPLRQIPIPNNLEPMPVLQPRTDLIDNMPIATPMPACEEQTH